MCGEDVPARPRGSRWIPVEAKAQPRAAYGAHSDSVHTIGHADERFSANAH